MKYLVIGIIVLIVIFLLVIGIAVIMFDKRRSSK